MIRKPGATVSASPLPKPILPKPVSPAAPAPAPAAAAPAAPAPAPAAAPAPAPAAAAPSPNPLQQLKSVTQKLKGVTQEIPQQAILRKTGIIAEDAMSEAQKAAAKHKTARISLSDAMGVAPVKNETAPLKTIRIKRPVDLPGSTASLMPQPKAAADGAQPGAPAEAPADEEKPTVTQRKTLKIARPGGAVRPAGKFGVKRPAPADAAADANSASTAVNDDAVTVVKEVAEIADIPDISAAPQPARAAAAEEGSSLAWTISALVQAAACVAIGALAWFLYQNSQTQYF